MLRRLLPLALLLALVGAGCGDDHKAENAYVQSISDIRRAWDTKIQTVARDAPTTATKAEDEELLKSYADATTTLITALRGAKVPGSVKDEHGKLVAGYVQFLTSVDDARAKARTGKPEERKAARAELSTANEALQTASMQAIQAINTKLQG